MFKFKDMTVLMFEDGRPMPYCIISVDGYNSQNLSCLSCKGATDCITIAADCQAILTSCRISLLAPYLVSNHTAVRELACHKLEELKCVS